MANKYLDSTGLTYFWNKLKTYVSNVISGKVDKVINATNGNFAALDSNGNLTDSGHKHSDYLTLHLSLSNYVTLDGALNITGEKTFVGTKRIKFKQSSSSDKLGFTLYNTSSVESGNFEGDIANRAINLGIYFPNSKPASDWLVGFKILAQDSGGTVHKYGLRTPPRLGNGTYTEYYIPVVINGVSASNAGVLTLTASDVGALPSTTVVPDDSDLVHKTEDETIGGDKTFTGVINATDINGDLYGAIYASHAEISGGVILPPVDGNLGTLTLESLYDDNAQLIVGNSQGYPEGETPEDQATGGWSQLYNEATDTTLQDELDARENVQADWNQTTTTADDYIKNKPTIPDVSDKENKTSIATSLPNGALSLNTYYSLSTALTGAVTITLPTVTDTTHVNSIGISFSTGSGFISLTITPPTGVNVSYYDGYTIEASAEYEINLLFNGTKWIVSYAVIS